MKPKLTDSTSYPALYDLGSAPARDERRRHPRYLVTRPLLAIPILPGWAPNRQGLTDGITIDVSQAGLRFEIQHSQQMKADKLLIGVENDDGQTYFITVRVRHQTATKIGSVFGVQFLPTNEDALHPDNLAPTVQPPDYRFRLSRETTVLNQWVEIGVLRPVLLDYAEVCPECSAVPSLRQGCPNCGGAHLVSVRMIHHFACAHVAPVLRFESDGKIVCPKCRMCDLVVGADFEQFDGPSTCLDCKWSGTELEQIAQCLGCGLRYPHRLSIEQEILGYHVRRLDPFRLVDSN